MQPASVDSSLDFRPRQVVYLEHEGNRLYAEVIQLVELRHMCWVRPLMLVLAEGLQSHDCQDITGLALPDVDSPLMPLLHDLRYGSDLLFPLHLFQAALDTDVVPLLAQLYELQPHNDTIRIAQQQIHQFIRQLWQSYPNSFQA